jgi:hypothetical protein
MQTLIYKTPLFVESAPSWLAPNSPVKLCLQADGTVVAFARRPSRWLALFGPSRLLRIGVLNEAAGYFLRQILDAGTHLRIRIVELQPSHLAVDRHARISVSVWGSVAKMTPLRVISSVGSVG